MDEYQEQLEKLRKGQIDLQELIERTHPKREAKIKTIIVQNEERRKQLEEKFANGEISQKEYNAQKKAINDGIKALKSVKAL